MSPELKYHWFRDGRPFMTPYLIHRVYQALNFSKNKIYRRYTFLGALYHPNNNVALGPFVGVQEYKWFSTEAFEQRTSASYEIEFKSKLFGLLLSVTI